MSSSRAPTITSPTSLGVLRPTRAWYFPSEATVLNLESGITYSASLPGWSSDPAAIIRMLAGLPSNLPAICARMNDT